MAKVFKDLSILALNEIGFSDQYVSSTPVVLHAGLNDLLRRMPIAMTIKNEESDAFSEVEYKNMTTQS